MTTPKAKDLTFIRLGDVPFHKCNMCGTPVKKNMALMASIPISDNASYDLIFCNDKCKDLFINNPMADAYINDGVVSAIKAHNSMN